jgi:putative hydrolase of the HAD superfamily
MITTLIFDWGGVLTIGKYTLSILETISKGRKIIIDETYPEFDKLIVEMNIGKINFKEFVQKIEEKFSLNILEEEMKEIFRKSIIPNEEVIQVVRDLNSKYNLVMLSDNDEVTVENLEKYHKDMLSLFSRKYFSHELKMRKPNLDFFRYVLKDLNLKGSECVFIDDKQKNVDAAIEVGMKGILFTNVEQLKKELVRI